MRSAYFSNKIYICHLCGEERNGNVDTSKRPLCWLCVHMLMGMSEEQKLRLYRKYEDRKDVQKRIESFMKEIAYENGRTLERRRFSRSAGIANRQNRQVKDYK